MLNVSLLRDSMLNPNICHASVRRLCPETQVLAAKFLPQFAVLKIVSTR